jgi:hypothetical protein
MPLRNPELLNAAMRTKRAVLLLVMTLVLPGAAQLTAGNRTLGRLGLRLWLAVLGGVGLTGLVALLDRRLALSLVTSSWALLLVVLTLVVGAVGWPLYFADAWRLGTGALHSPRSRRAVSVLAVTLVLMTSVPLAYAARQVSVGRSVLAGVFGGSSGDAGEDGRYNVLLLGGDAGTNRVGTRPDSLTLVSVDADTGRSVLFSLPRNMENIPFRRTRRCTRRCRTASTAATSACSTPSTPTPQTTRASTRRASRTRAPRPRRTRSRPSPACPSTTTC